MKMKFICTYIFALLALCGCVESQKTVSTMFMDVVYAPSYAEGFEILGSDEAKSTLLRITRPWQGDQVESFELLILRGDEKAPSNFQGAVIQDYASRIVALSSSNVAMFDRLGQARNLVGVSGLDYISSENIQRMAKEKNVADVGFDTNLNYELLKVLHPDLVLLYSVGGKNNSVTSKLDELSIPYIYIGDYAEESPLGKAEWMVAMGEICGKREDAESLFTQSVDKYNALKQKVVDAGSRPTVMLNTPYRDIWYMPSSRSYMVRLVDDAGAKYIYEGNDSSQSKPISVEEAYKLTSIADFWINTGATINSLGDLRSQVQKFMDMPAVKRGEVYNNTARRTPMGGSDFWESGVVYPELVLQDLIMIFHPNIVEAEQWGEELYYYQKLK